MTSECKDDHRKVREKSHWTFPCEVVNLSALIKRVAHKEVCDNGQYEVG